MRDSYDKRTLTIGELPKLRGRPSTGKAMTVAERQKAHRAKKRREKNEQLREVANVYRQLCLSELAEKLQQFVALSIRSDKQDLQDAKTVWLELGRRNGWL